MTNQPSRDDKARSLYIHCGASENQLSPTSSSSSASANNNKNNNNNNNNNSNNAASHKNSRFWKCRGIESHDGKAVGAAAAEVGPDALSEIQSADHEKIVTSVRERRKRQLEERAAEIAAAAEAKKKPTHLSGKVLDQLTEEEYSRRGLLQTVSQAQWFRVVECGRAAQIPIALGDRKLTKFVSGNQQQQQQQHATEGKSHRTRSGSAATRQHHHH